MELASINVQKDIAAEQAKIVAEALKSARIDIVGGDNNFFNRLVNSITTGKAVDRMIENSDALTGLKNTLLGGDAELNRENIRRFIDQFGLSAEDIKNLSVSALVVKLMADADEGRKGLLSRILHAAKEIGIADMPAEKLLAEK